MKKINLSRDFFATEKPRINSLFGASTNKNIMAAFVYKEVQAF